MRCIAYRLKCGIVVSNDQSVLGYSHRAWISYGVYCFFIESWGSCVSQSHDDRPHTPWLRRSQHGPTAHVIPFACHNYNSSRTSYTMSESEIRSQTRHKYPTCIRACVIVHMRLQQSQHGPLRASRRLRGTSVRNTTQEPRSTHLCATHASAHDGATHASKAHLGPRTRGVNILQPVTPHSTPPRRAECLPLPTPESVEPVETIIYHAGTERGSHARGFRPKEDPSCSQAGGGFRRKEDRMHERVSSGAHA